MAVAARRIGAAQQQGALNVMPMAVGFLDLVGFTTLAAAARASCWSRRRRS
jgi:hypothetical protein